MIYCSVCGRPTSDQGPTVCDSCTAAAPAVETVEVELQVPSEEADTGEIHTEIGGQPVTLVQDGGYWKVVHLGPES